MMLVGTLFSSLFGGAAVAGTAVAATAGAASTGLTILSGIGSAFTALSTISAGYAKANELKAAAKEEQFRATDERIKGEQESAKLQKDLALTIQRQKVAFAASGVELGSQAVGQAQSEAKSDAERQLGYAHYDAERAALARQRQARNLQLQAQNAVSSGYASAFGGLVDFSTDAFLRYG